MRTRHIFLSAFVALGLTATACSSDSENEPASAGDVSATDATDAPDSAGESALEYAQCMRGEGVENFPDPEINGGQVRLVPGDIDPDDPEVQAAEETCAPLLERGGGFEVDEERGAQLQEAALAFAECMRGQGIDFPDPQVDGGRVTMGGPGGGLDVNSPKFRSAVSECQAQVPEMTGGGQP